MDAECCSRAELSFQAGLSHASPESTSPMRGAGAGRRAEGAEGGLAAHAAAGRQPGCSAVRLPPSLQPRAQFVGLDLAIVQLFCFLISKPTFLLKPLRFSPYNC